MCSYAVSRGKSAVFQAIFLPLFMPRHRRAQCMALAFRLVLLLPMSSIYSLLTLSLRQIR